MKKIECFVKDSEHDALEAIKGAATWRVSILRAFGLPVEDIPLGRPRIPQDDMNDLFQFKTSGPVTHEVRSPEPSETTETPEKQDEMGMLFEPYKKETKK